MPCANKTLITTRVNTPPPPKRRFHSSKQRGRSHLQICPLLCTAYKRPNQITSTKITPHVNHMHPNTRHPSNKNRFKNPVFPGNADNVAKHQAMDSSRSDLWTSKKKKSQNPVFLEGYVESYAQEEDHCSSKSVSRTVSLTDEDLDELKGCVDLGFGFNYEEIPELCGTLPALELCYSIQQKFLDDQNKISTSTEENADSDGMNENEISSVSTSSASPIANWKISSPGDDPEEVKARLKYWAQAVACTVKLCS